MLKVSILLLLVSCVISGCGVFRDAGYKAGTVAGQGMGILSEVTEGATVGYLNVSADK